MIDILVPVLGRPRNAAPLVESIRDSTRGVTHCIIFLCSPGDDAQIDQALQWGDVVIVVTHQPEGGDYARKINIGIKDSKMPWILMGSDDLHFEPGWAEEALEVAEQTGKRVIATNDMANPEVMRGRHATHPLVARSYIEEYGTIDAEGFYCEEYDHQCVDVEATETAQARDEFAFAKNSIVRHMHPIFNRAVEMDQTYRKALEHGQRDRDLMLSRRRLWNPNYRSARRR